MKKVTICMRCVRAAFDRIHLVDKCLLLIFLVLLLQSAYSLFFHVGANAEAEHIDVIVRTSLAAIFGYVLSANFMRNTERRQMDGDEKTKEYPGEDISSQSIEDERGGTSLRDLEAGSGDDRRERHMQEDRIGRLQIIMATAIGLFGLAVLLLRDVPAWNADLAGSASAAATAAQFRDFVSGCVGFLIGCPTERRA